MQDYTTKRIVFLDKLRRKFGSKAVTSLKSWIQKIENRNHLEITDICKKKKKTLNFIRFIPDKKQYRIAAPIKLCGLFRAAMPAKSPICAYFKNITRILAEF